MVTLHRRTEAVLERKGKEDLVGAVWSHTGYCIAACRGWKPPIWLLPAALNSDRIYPGKALKDSVHARAAGSSLIAGRGRIYCHRASPIRRCGGVRVCACDGEAQMDRQPAQKEKEGGLQFLSSVHCLHPCWLLCNLREGWGFIMWVLVWG